MDRTQLLQAIAAAANGQTFLRLLALAFAAGLGFGLGNTFAHDFWSLP